MTQLPVASTLNQLDLPKHRAGLLPIWRDVGTMPAGCLRGASALQLGTGDVGAPGRTHPARSQCCPFLRFQLTVEPGRGPIWLELTGPAGTREFVAHEIGDPGPV